jgi:hypothetical protein
MSIVVVRVLVRRREPAAADALPDHPLISANTCRAIATAVLAAGHPA